MNDINECNIDNPEIVASRDSSNIENPEIVESLTENNSTTSATNQTKRRYNENISYFMMLVYN